MPYHSTIRKSAFKYKFIKVLYLYIFYCFFPDDPLINASTELTVLTTAADCSHFKDLLCVCKSREKRDVGFVLCPGTGDFV